MIPSKLDGTRFAHIAPRITAEELIARSAASQENFVDSAMAAYRVRMAVNAFRLREAREERRRKWLDRLFALLVFSLIGIAAEIVSYVVRHP